MKEIPLTQGKSAIVDDEDYEKLIRIKWRVQKDRWDSGKERDNHYAVSDLGGKKTLMHRLLMQPGDKEVDHINHNGLDNRRSNLRICSRSENNQNQRIRANNTSGFKGVSRKGSKWCARIGGHTDRKHLGYFTDRISAALARDDAALELYGEFARLNFPFIYG